MKLIYLDIDGVLCTHRACTAIGAIGESTGTMDYLDPIACKLVERLVTEFDARIVISSTWRLNRSRREILQIFRCAGHRIIASAIHDSWRTPELLAFARSSQAITCNEYTGFARRRGREIELSLCEIDNNENVTRYVIIDDDPDILEYQIPCFVQCDIYDGLGFRQYEKARSILGA